MHLYLNSSLARWKLESGLHGTITRVCELIGAMSTLALQCGVGLQVLRNPRSCAP